MKLLIIQLEQIAEALKKEEPATPGQYLTVARSALAHAIDAMKWEAEARDLAAAPLEPSPFTPIVDPPPQSKI